MNRRTFLRTGGAGVLVGLAGCMGYSVENADEVEARRNRIEELEADLNETQSELTDRESRIEELESDIEQRESQISELESANEDNEAEIESLEAEVEALNAAKVTDLYSFGYEQQDVGFNDFGTAVEQRDNDWKTSMAYMARAEGRFLTAVNAFDEALTTAQDEGFSSVTGMIDESMQAVQHYATASNAYANAAYLYADGQDSSAEQWDSDAADAFEQGQQLTIAEPSEVESTL